MKKTIRRKDWYFGKYYNVTVYLPKPKSSETNTLDTLEFPPGDYDYEIWGIPEVKIESELHGDMQRGSDDASPRLKRSKK